MFYVPSIGASPPQHCQRPASPERHPHGQSRNIFEEEHLKHLESIRHSHSITDRIKGERYLSDLRRSHMRDSHNHMAHPIPYMHLSPRAGTSYYNGHKIAPPICHRSSFRSRSRNHRLSPVSYPSSSHPESARRDSPDEYRGSPREMPTKHWSAW